MVLASKVSYGIQDFFFTGMGLGLLIGVTLTMAGVYRGMVDDGKALLDKVGKEIIDLNNKGVMAARNGDLEGAVQLLIQAVEQVPNLQFLVNAAKAIFTLLDKKGWDAEMAAKAREYLVRAQRKDKKNPKIASARELYASVAKKYGVTPD